MTSANFISIMVVLVLWIASSSYYSYMGWFRSARFEKEMEKRRVPWPDWIVKHALLGYTRQPLAATWAMRVIGPLMMLLGVVVGLLVVLRFMGVIY